MCIFTIVSCPNCCQQQMITCTTNLLYSGQKKEILRLSCQKNQVYDITDRTVLHDVILALQNDNLRNNGLELILIHKHFSTLTMQNMLMGLFSELKDKISTIGTFLLSFFFKYLHSAKYSPIRIWLIEPDCIVSESNLSFK